MDIGELLKLWGHADDVAKVICYIVAAASVIIKLTPTLKDDNFLLPIVKFLSKWVAWNRKTKDDVLRK